MADGALGSSTGCGQLAGHVTTTICMLISQPEWPTIGVRSGQAECMIKSLNAKVLPLCWKRRRTGRRDICIHRNLPALPSPIVLLSLHLIRACGWLPPGSGRIAQAFLVGFICVSDEWLHNTTRVIGRPGGT